MGMTTPPRRPFSANREEQFLIAGPKEGLRLFVTRMSATSNSRRRSVLYVHGATFPSSLAVAYRFGTQGSWRDALCRAGFDVWAFDFYGYGGSDRYPEMDGAADAAAPLGLAAEGAQQLAAVVAFALEHDGRHSISFISHSWGSMPVGRFAAEHAAAVDRWVLFAPLARREPSRQEPIPSGPAWRLVSIEDQWKRFVEDVPASEPPVLGRSRFDEWAKEYLASDPGAASRVPPAVKTPSGPYIEILRAWHGNLAYEPAKVRAPIAIVRGAWDGLVQDADARWLFDAFSQSSDKRDFKIARGTHLMLLETMRGALWSASAQFLLGDEASTPVAALDAGHAPLSPSLALSGRPAVPDKAASPPKIAGYNPGSPEVTRSPISMDELRDLKASCLFTDEDMIYLRLSHDVLKDQAEALVAMWRGIIAQHPHLARYSWDRDTQEPDKEYGEKVGKRFARWVLDTARAEYDQQWLDYQYEIGLRHHRSKKNLTDGAHAADHIRGRDLIAFAAATVSPMRPYLERGGHSADVVLRMQEAWWKSVILQVTLWSQPYMNADDF
jgi:pimeloyl-ACP methyl ester carboxylesterase